MRRLPSSWLLIKAKLGVICAGPNIKNRHHAAPNRPLRGIEVLEDRRVLSAVGYFVRQDSITNGDVYSEANAIAHARQQAGWLPYQAETDTDNVNSGATNEMVAHAGAGFATSLVDHADGGSVGNALAQVPTDILDTTVVRLYLL